MRSMRSPLSHLLGSHGGQHCAVLGVKSTAVAAGTGQRLACCGGATAGRRFLGGSLRCRLLLRLPRKGKLHKGMPAKVQGLGFTIYPMARPCAFSSVWTSALTCSV